MTVRIIVRIEDPTDILNYDGALKTYYRTVDIENQELERLLYPPEPQPYTSIDVIGAEIIKEKTHD